MKFEAGSKQVLEITALGASVDLILKTSITIIEEEILKLSRRLNEGLKDLGYSTFYNNGSIVNFIPSKFTEKQLQSLPCNFAKRGPGIRLSPHAFNSISDIDQVLAVLKE